MHASVFAVPASMTLDQALKRRRNTRAFLPDWFALTALAALFWPFRRRPRAVRWAVARALIDRVRWRRRLDCSWSRVLTLAQTVWPPNCDARLARRGEDHNACPCAAMVSRGDREIRFDAPPAPGAPRSAQRLP